MSPFVIGQPCAARRSATCSSGACATRRVRLYAMKYTTATTRKTAVAQTAGRKFRIGEARAERHERQHGAKNRAKDAERALVAVVPNPCG